MLTRAFVLAAIGGALAWFPSAALEIQGASFFTNPPWRVELTAFYNTVWDPQPDHAFTVELPANAGAPLGGLTIQQTRGSDWWFPYDVERTSAYVGRPRAEGRKLPVTATFDPEIRRFEIRFDPPRGAGHHLHHGAQTLE